MEGIQLFRTFESKTGVRTNDDVRFTIEVDIWEDGFAECLAA